MRRLALNIRPGHVVSISFTWVLLCIGLILCGSIIGCGAPSEDAARESGVQRPETSAPPDRSHTIPELRPPEAAREMLETEAPDEAAAEDIAPARPADASAAAGAKPAGNLPPGTGASHQPVAPAARKTAAARNARPPELGSRPPLAPRAPTAARTGVINSQGAARSAPVANETPPASRSAQASQPFHAVDVFYATDRQRLATLPASRPRQPSAVLITALVITLLSALLACFPGHRRLAMGMVVVGLVTSAILGTDWITWALHAGGEPSKLAVRYGNERGELQYGTCQVTIPASHVSGEMERPSILRLEVREDAARHIVLQATEPSEQEAFFDQLRSAVAASRRPEVFVFVHGYNVTFEAAARRTAQIADDVDFAGAPIFFSWPSQGGLLEYTVDETNVEWTVPHLRQFLVDVARRSGATSVNLIAHSMGNRALTSALHDLQLQLGEESTLFNQIILAAPDIDAEIFRRDLAPALVRSARQVTLYASSGDQALQASKKVHGYARAGDSGDGLVVLPGIETIDVSALDSSLLGHSYYGNSNPVLLDIRELIQYALPAAERPALTPRTYQQLTYWVLQKARATARRTLAPAEQ